MIPKTRIGCQNKLIQLSIQKKLQIKLGGWYDNLKHKRNGLSKRI